jgi:hypothetical protein
MPTRIPFGALKSSPTRAPLSLAQNELTLTVLDTEGARDLASQIAVEGCGKKAVYVYYPDTNTWILDGVVASAPP